MDCPSSPRGTPQRAFCHDPPHLKDAAMSLKDRITDDMKLAMRAKDADRLGTIRMLLAACKQREVDERIVLDDAAVVGIVDKMIKQRKDSVAAFQQGGRADLADKESAEIAVLQAYLPQRLSAEETLAAVTALVAELGASGPGDMGRVMAAAKAQLAGKAEMAQVSAAVKQALAK
jgi:uncharacterized protein YqeY